MLEENKKFEIEDKKKEEYNKQHVAMGRSDLSDFMKNMYNENNSGAGFRPDVNELIKKDVLKMRNKEKSPSPEKTCRSRSRSKEKI